MNNLLLGFYMTLDETRQLNRGRLFLLDTEKGELGRWIATSGIGTHQGVGDWDIKGRGVIPPLHQVKNAPAFYSVSTTPDYIPNNPGIKGYAYLISPVYVDLKSGVNRGEFFIHEDANVNTSPGSAGCIVLAGAEWDDFRKVFDRETKARDLKTVKLHVGYVY